MKASAANLEKTEQSIRDCLAEGQMAAQSLNDFVYQVRKFDLYKAGGFKTFKEWCESGRIKISYSHLQKLAGCGEVEQCLEKYSAEYFSDNALRALSQIRIERKDMIGNVKKTHDLDRKKIKRVADKALAKRAKAINTGKRKEYQVTASEITEAVANLYGYKEPPTMAETFNRYSRQATRLLSSLEAAMEIDNHIFSDADEESPGSAKRLATAYSKLTSFLRKV